MATQPDPHLIAAVEEALTTPTFHRDDTPLPRYGTTPPIPQPGAPPMSPRTTEVARAVMLGSLATVPPGLIAIGILVASEHANPTVIGMICAAPAAVAAPIWALARLVKASTKSEHHHHYTGPVRQQTVTSHSRWLGKTTNNM
ncbi:hypothetical protein [Streptomyces pacificus]|uniref:Uncharacterized protein n=1 Tax=Streptomyces pacificus TaxID=2705029 RepID=A0A6A0AMW5_9ACTN|nr:hypothetical protein [Streptomyces pacificus]GFH34310.1 hypothetical protein SCWH03_05240 [Streptomyces pacificus]